MLPIDRLNRIKELIHINKSIKISELSKELNVSEMTIHRDIKPLINEGIIIKTFGGIALADNIPSNACAYCSKNISDHRAYRIILPESKIETCCCSHCGLLRHRQHGSKVIQAICTDFLKDTTISAQLAFYVFDTSIDIGCCQPQVLSFEQKAHAERFIKGFGGTVHPFKEALEVVHRKMNHPCGCDH